MLSVVYETDIGGESFDGAGWSSAPLSTSPNGYEFIGQFSRNQSTTLKLKDLDAHQFLLVAVDLYIIGSWDGESTELENAEGKLFGKDEWYFKADGRDVLRTTFSNHTMRHEAYGQRRRQAYGGAYAMPGDHPAKKSADYRNVLGYTHDFEHVGTRGADAIYRLELAFPHTADSATLQFGGNLTGGKSDESWGMSSVQVLYMNYQLPKTPTLRADIDKKGNARILWSPGGWSELQRRVGPDGEWEPVAVQRYGEFHDDGLTTGVDYSYRVRRMNPAGHSPWSDEITVAHHEVSFSAPKTIMQGEPLTIQLDKGTAPSVDAWEISWDFGKIQTISGDATSTMFLLDDWSEIQINVEVWARIGKERFKAKSAAVEIIPTETVTLSSKIRYGEETWLHWTNPAKVGTGYVIERSRDGQTWKTIRSNWGDRWFLDSTGVKEGRRYFYRVRIRTGNHLSANVSNVVKIYELPAEPEDFQAKVLSPTSAKLTWSDMSERETGYLITYREGETGKFKTLGETGPDVETYIATNLTPRRTYFFDVWALGKGGMSGFYGWWPDITMPTAGPLPAAPKLLPITVVSPTQVDLEWIDQSDNETEFRIQRRPRNNSRWETIGTVGANVTTYSDTTALADETYVYRIRPRNQFGPGEGSNVRVVATSLQAPSDFEIVAHYEDKDIEVRWMDNSPNEDGFYLRIYRASDGKLVSRHENWSNKRTGPRSADIIVPKLGVEYAITISAYAGKFETAESEPVTITPVKKTLSMDGPEVVKWGDEYTITLNRSGYEGPMDWEIDWGDSTTEIFTTDADGTFQVSHLYEAPEDLDSWSYDIDATVHWLDRYGFPMDWLEVQLTHDGLPDDDPWW